MKIEKRRKKVSVASFSNTMRMVLLFCGITGVAHGTVLLTEDFSYPDGSLTAVSGGTWTLTSGSSGQMDVLSGAVNLTFSESEDTARSIASTDSGTLYFGISVNFSVAPSAAGTYFAHFNDGQTGADTDFFGRLTVKQGSSPSTVVFGVANDSGNAAIFSSTEVALNSTARIVVGFEFSTMTSTVWVDPTDIGSPSATDPVAAVFSAGGPTSLNTVNLRQATGMGGVAVDDLIVATTFEEALAVPEPSIYGLLIGGVAVACLLKRRRVASLSSC